MYIEGLEKANQLLKDIEMTRKMNEEAIEEMFNGGKTQKAENMVFYNNTIMKMGETA